MNFRLLIALLFLSAALGSVAQAEDNFCGPFSSVADLLHGNCEINLALQGCKGLDAKDPDVKGLVRTCPEPQDPEASLAELASGCGAGWGDAWIDLYKTLLRDPYVYLTKTSAESTHRYLEDCGSSLDCKKALFVEAHQRQPSPGDIEKLDKMKDIAQLDILFRTALSVHNSSGQQNLRLTQALENERALRTGDALPTPKDSSFWLAVKEAIGKKTDKFACLTHEGKALMVCYALGSIIDPLAIVGIVGKVPKLASLMRSVSKAGKVADAPADGARTREIVEALDDSPKKKAQPITVDKPINAKSVKSWNKYSEQFQKTTYENIMKSEERYKQALNENHPHIAFLKKIGYKFEIGPDGRLVAEVPRLEDAIKAYDALMQEYVKAGRIAAQDVLEPRRLFEVDGKIVTVKIGDPIPAGARPYESLMANKDYESLLGVKRQSPVGENTMALYSKYQSAAEHDLSHLSGYSEFPEYQKELSQLYKQTTKSPSRFRNRVYYASEFLEGVTPANRPKLLDFFRENKVSSDKFASRPATSGDFVAAVKNKSDSDLKAMINTLYDKRYDLIKLAGGASRDLMDRKFSLEIAAKQNGRLEHLRGPTGRIEMLKRELEKNPSAAMTNKQREAVTDLLASLENTSRIDFAQFAREAAKPSLERSSPMYQYICKNRLLGEVWRKDFCGW